MNRMLFGKITGLIYVITNITFVNYLEAENSDYIKAMFADPPRQYSSSPLWVWNDMLTEEQIISTLNDLADQKVKQVFVHPRPGLMTPYLSEQWFRLWKTALKEAERLDMNIWIYDENSYPSGFAGGLVPEALPEARGRGLILREQEEPPEWSDDMIAVYRFSGDGYENVTDAVQAKQEMPPGRFVVASIQRAENSPWFGDRCYVDLLYPGVTEKFIEITLEAYRRQVGEQFGKRIPGTFTDEPHLRPAGGFAWTDDLAAKFQQRWGYSLIDNLPCLNLPVGDWKRLRHNYYQLLLELFNERWGKPIYEYCQRNQLEFTGHYWEHEWPNCGLVPDNMALYAWHQRPAIDTLMNQYREDTHAQFGNVRAVMELAGVANQLSRSRTLCEAYGAGGWDLRLEDMKRIGDWLFVLGVNTLDEHLSYVSIRGARKRDHPQSFSYHEPWWQAYHVMASYFTRLSLALSHGQQINSILLIEPTTTAWIYQSDSDRLNELGNRFQEMVVSLAKAQVEFDIGCEDIIARHGSISNSRFKVGRCLYDTVVIGPSTENLNAETVKLLASYLEAGGAVICCGSAPTLMEGAPAPRLEQIWRNENFQQIDPTNLAKILRGRAHDGFAVRCGKDDRGILFHQRRQFADGDLLFLVNTSIDFPSQGIIDSSAQSVQKWNPQDGAIAPYPCQNTTRRIETVFHLPPCGSLLLFLAKISSYSAPVEVTKSATIPPQGRLGIRRLESNVLTLDYVDITAGVERKEDIYFYQANQFAFQKNGISRNPWDSAVQFRDELIKIKFPPESGFEASYHFTIEGELPKSLYAVVERPDLYRITCNGKTVTATSGSWWLDKSFGKIDIFSTSNTGENTLTIRACPMTIYHELEPVYILGDFVLRPGASGFIIVPDRALKMDSGKTHSDAPEDIGWNMQGHPFYAAGVSYIQNFMVNQSQGRFLVQLSRWYGSVARVNVNGEIAGYIAYQPWQCDVTKLIKEGTNAIEVVVIGTLKNTLGPHHGNPPLGSAWPGMFQYGPSPGPPPGNQYHNVGYGLFEPFELVQLLPR